MDDELRKRVENLEREIEILKNRAGRLGGVKAVIALLPLLIVMALMLLGYLKFFMGMI